MGKMLTVQMTKRKDGASVLRCVRADGSVTWQKQDRHAAFFALHDLTHFAVESTLGFHDGFFGLIAQGWDIEETTGKEARGRLGEEAIVVERIVGLIGQERASGAMMTADEFSGFAGRRVEEAELQSVRSLCAELFWQWRELPPGSTLQLSWGK